MKKISVSCALLIVLLSVNSVTPLYAATKIKIETSLNATTNYTDTHIKPAISSRQTTAYWLRSKITHAKNTVWGQYNFKKHYLRRLLLLAGTTLGASALYLQKAKQPAAPAPIVPPAPAPVPAPALAPLFGLGPVGPLAPPIAIPGPAFFIPLAVDPALAFVPAPAPPIAFPDPAFFIPLAAADPAAAAANMPPLILHAAQEQVLISCLNCEVENLPGAKQCIACNQTIIDPKKLTPAQRPPIILSAMIKCALLSEKKCKSMVPWLCKKYPKETKELGTCPYCLDDIIDLISENNTPNVSPINAPCPHLMCITCKKDIEDNNQTVLECPLCRTPCHNPLVKCYEGQSRIALQEAIAKQKEQVKKIEKLEKEFESTGAPQFAILLEEYQKATKRCCDNPDNCAHAKP